MLAMEALLAPFGFDITRQVKLARHQDSQYDVDSLVRVGQFDCYQAIQRRPVFGACDMVLSFVGRSITLTAREVIEYEILHKCKLGSRAHGLNSN